MTETQRSMLSELPATLATRHGLDAEIHPGYRHPPDQPGLGDEDRAS